MLESLIKWVGALAPFMAPYPGWVKMAFGIFILSGATWFMGLVVASPSKPGPDAQTAAPLKPTTDAQTVWLTIKGVTVFGSHGLREGDGVRVTATINNVEYIYPSLAGVDWLEIGPEMARQSYQIPLRDIYAVRFAAETRDGRKFASVEEHRINGKTNGVMTYELREINSRLRVAPVTAGVRFTITRDSP